MINNNTQEKILCAAIWYKNVNPRAVHRPKNTPGGVVLCGYRHGDVISQVASLTGKKHHELGESVQGFLTNRNRFLDRKEAAKIFVEDGGELQYTDDELFSEDLY